MNTTNPNGILAIFPEHRPEKWYKPWGPLKLVWTVEYCTSWMSSMGEEVNRNRKRFSDPAKAFKLFEEWRAKYPKADVQCLVPQ